VIEAKRARATAFLPRRFQPAQAVAAVVAAAAAEVEAAVVAAAALLLSLAVAAVVAVGRAVAVVAEAVVEWPDLAFLFRPSRSPAVRVCLEVGGYLSRLSPLC
jgi:hypothetical protein